MLDATKDFDVNKAFNAVDDWNYGFIDKKNLKNFLRNYYFDTGK